MAIETLRPNGAGDKTEITSQVGLGAHWELVDEVVADDDSTYVRGTNFAVYYRDLYKLPASSGEGLINKITVYARFKCDNEETIGYDKHICIKSGRTESAKGVTFSPDVWTTFSEEWTTNPYTSAAWIWADIDALQIGIDLRRPGSGYSYCTQVYVEVDYTPSAAVPRHAFINFQGPGIF